MNKRKTRVLAALMSVLMVIGAVAGLSWAGVSAEDANTYMVDDNWTLIPQADVDAKFGASTCRDAGKYDADAKEFGGIGRGTVIKVENVDFGTGKKSLELSLSVTDGAANTQIYVYVGDDSYGAAVHVPQARYLLSPGPFSWVAPLACDFSGITGKQTVYIVGAGNKGNHSSVNGLRFAEAKSHDNYVDYIANPTTWSVTAGKASYSGALNGATIGGTGAGTNTILVKDVDFTDAVGIQLITATNNSAKTLTVLAGEDEIADVEINTRGFSFYGFSQTVDLAGKNLTGKKDVTLTTQANNFNVMGVRVFKTIPEVTEPDTYRLNDDWKLLTKDEVNADHSGVCRDIGNYKAATKEVTAMGRGTVVRIENVDFGNGKRSMELSLNVSDKADNARINVFIGDDSYKANAKEGGVLIPEVRYNIKKTGGEYVWTAPFTCDLTGITGKQTVYIVAASAQGSHFSLNGLRFAKAQDDPTIANYVANPTTWTVTEGNGKYGNAINGCTIGGNNQKGTHTFVVKDVDFTGAKTMRFIVGSAGGAKTLNVFIDDAAEAIGTITTVQSNYQYVVPSSDLDLNGKDLTGKHTVKVVSTDINFDTLALQLTVDPDAINPDPDGTYTARVSRWRIVPASEHGYDDRGAAEWDAEQGAFTGVGRCSIIEVNNVDFKDGYNFMELLLNVPENCNERFVHVFVDDYTTGNPQARFYMTKTADGEFEWQGQFCESFSSLTGVHKVYIVGATDNKGFNFSLKGLRLSKVTVEPSDETLYVTNDADWKVVGGFGGAYIKDPNGCGIGKNNEAMLRVSGIDFTGVTGISLLTGCNGGSKRVAFYGKDPVKYFDDPMELGELDLPAGDYAHFIWSDYLKITGKGMTGVHDLYIQSLGVNFDYRALRTTKKDLGPADVDSSDEDSSDEDSGSDEPITPDDSSDDNSADNPDTGVATAALPVLLAAVSAAAIPAIRRKRAR